MQQRENGDNATAKEGEDDETTTMRQKKKRDWVRRAQKRHPTNCVGRLGDGGWNQKAEDRLESKYCETISECAKRFLIPTWVVG